MSFEDKKNIMKSALNGVKVIDISNFLAGPVSSMFLGDFGAEVIKIEKPDLGDEIRYWGNSKNGIGLMYKLINRNKKSFSDKKKKKIGVEIVKRLIKNADIIVENYRTGTLEKWGLSYEILSKINPRLIMIRITGFGQTGPYSHKSGFGTLAEGFSGFASINGYPDRSPLLPGFGLADETSGLMGAFLALTALRERDQISGKGQVVEFAIYEPLLTLLGPQVVDYDQLGIIQKRNGSRLPFTAPRNTYQTRDNKWVSISGSAQSTFERMCDALGIKELIYDERFLDNRLRIKNSKILDELLQKAILNFDQENLIKLFDQFGAAIAACNDISEIFKDKHIKSRENIVEIEDNELGGSLKMQNIVGNFSRTPGEIKHAGPKLGQHNFEVLIKELGFSKEELIKEGYEIDNE